VPARRRQNSARILIAHQSSIPHYRVSFYNALERLRPDWWDFDVVFAVHSYGSPNWFQTAGMMDTFHFPILPTRLFSVTFNGRKIHYQNFWYRAADYDLVIVENAVNNIAYPLCQLHQYHGLKVAYWGHDRDRKVTTPTRLKRLTENLKLRLSRRADGFFAYTDGVKKYLVDNGLESERVFVVNNTIDIDYQRQLFEGYRPQRKAIRETLRVCGKKTLLFVGRFTPNKRLEFLLESFSHLERTRPDFHLLLVGDGQLPTRIPVSRNVSLLGTLVDPIRLAPIYVASDVFVFPGAVGLGSLQALCYDLPVVSIGSLTHGPEIEYLVPGTNSLLLDTCTSPLEYAQEIIALFDSPDRLTKLRQNSWPTISHLTIEQMATNFIAGIGSILNA
jgi:glycosyltransferase involved in cell wall biosynthesis